MQIFNRRPSQRQAVEGRCSATDFVQYNERARACTGQDRGGFHHFNHEGRASPRQIISRPDPRIDPIHNADIGFGGRHKTAHLGDDGEQRILPQKGRFTRHIRAGEQAHARTFLASGIQHARIGDKGLSTLRAQSRLHHRVATALNHKSAIIIKFWRNPIFSARFLRQCRAYIDNRQRPAKRVKPVARGQNLRRQISQYIQLQSQSGFTGARYLSGQFGQFGGRKPHRAGQGLAMNKHTIMRRAHQLISMRGGHINMKSQHAIMFNLQRLNAGFFAITVLQSRNNASAFIAQSPRLIKVGMKAAANKSAIAR